MNGHEVDYFDFTYEGVENFCSKIMVEVVGIDY